MHTAELQSIPTLTQIGQGEGVYISTYGCQMNENDSERMMSLLEMMDFHSVPTPEQASLIIINSCSIREKPVHKVHSEVGRYRKMKEANPRLRIGVTGCVAQQEKDQLRADIPLLDFVLGTDAIDSLPEVIARVRLNNEPVVNARFQHQAPYHIETLIRNPGVSTFVNITKGCDNFCTFCVVPFTRGRERSRPLQHLLTDVQKLVDRGVREVTLLGQNVNSYESECGVNFAGLLKQLARQTGIERIRYTTSHPKDFNEELMDVMAEHQDKIMEFIHLPVQSGSSEVLERMHRGYSRDEYLGIVEMIYSRLPNAVLSTDIIVGFPGETEAQFQQTMSLLNEVAYENIFAFAYSPRPFTKAQHFSDQISESVKSQRLAQVLALHKETSYALAKQYLGQSLQILVEKFDDETGRVSGRSRQNKSVYFTGGRELIGQTVTVHIQEALPLVMRGERVV